MQLSRIDVVFAVLLVGIVTIGNENAVQRILFANRDRLKQALVVSLLTKNAGKLHLRNSGGKRRVGSLHRFDRVDKHAR